MYKLCQKMIQSSERPSVSTYCMRPTGHEGKCAPEVEIIVKDREECTKIPEGVSCTETIIAFYIRIRPSAAENRYLSIRVAKNPLCIASSELCTWTE